MDLLCCSQTKDLSSEETLPSNYLSGQYTWMLHRKACYEKDNLAMAWKAKDIKQRQCKNKLDNCVRHGRHKCADIVFNGGMIIESEGIVVFDPVAADNL